MGSLFDLFSGVEKDTKTLTQPELASVEFDPNVVCWGLSNLPIKYAAEHFLTCGTVGSGKSVNVRLFLQSIAPRFRANSATEEQLIIFDAKGDAVPILEGLGISPQRSDVWILNPFDTRGAKWAIGSAINSPAMARYFAKLIIPDEKSSAPYFNNAARQIVYWVTVALMNIRKNQWTLRDLINALESKNRILSVCKMFPRAEAAILQHCNDSVNFGGVLSSLETKIGEFHEVAALWDTSPSNKTFSIEDFLKKRGVVILGHDPVLHESIWPMNALMLNALTNEILRSQETKMPRHWFVLDEFRAMGRVDCIRNLLNLGRSKGASVLLGVQSIESLREIYGPDAAEDILQACSNKMFLRAGGAGTAEWAEKHFSRLRQVEREMSYSRGPGGNSTTEREHVQERSLFLASMFLDLSLPCPGGSFRAINDIPSSGVLINDWHADDVFKMLKPLGGEDGVKRRTDDENQYLRPWTAIEERNICNTTSPESTIRVGDAEKESRGDFPSKEAHRQRRYPG